MKNQDQTPQSGTPTPQDKEKKKKRKHSDSQSSSSGKSGEKKEAQKNNNIIKDLVAENFVMLTLIGKGAFGQIYLSYNMRENIEVAIKKEIKRPQKNSQLRTESKIYQNLLNISPQDVSGVKALQQEDVQGVPKFYGMGELLEGYYLIMEFLGPNLIELLNYCNTRKFTISTVCLIALQILNRIENLHKHHYLHRDIKPENFLIGTQDKSNIIYLIDFGLSKRFVNAKNNQHIPYREGRPLTGTARYVSINTHLGIEQSRRDDLESIAYVLIFFLKGSLPWQGLKTGNDKYQRIMEKKLQIPTEILCFGLPDELVYYLNYCKSLRFEDRPDYDYLRGLFIKLLGTCNSLYGLTKDMLKFDWCFDDPKNSIWLIYNKGKKNGCGSKAGDQFMKDLKENSGGNNSNASPDQNTNSRQLGGKQLSNIDENKDAYTKTNENNPLVSDNDDEDESSSKIDSEDKKNQSKNSENKEKDKEESKNDSSEETIKEDFRGFNSQNEKVNNELKMLLLTGQKDEEIDKYINRLLRECGYKTGKKEEEKKAEPKEEKKDEPKEEEKNEPSKSESEKESSSGESSSSEKGKEDVSTTPVIGGRNRDKLKDSLDIKSPDSPQKKTSGINVKEKEEEVEKVLEKEKQSSPLNNQELIRNTVRNSKIISPEEYNKIKSMGMKENKKEHREKEVKFRTEVKEFGDKNETVSSKSSKEPKEKPKKKKILTENNIINQDQKDETPGGPEKDPKTTKKSFENEIMPKISNPEIKERRRSKILDMNALPQATPVPTEMKVSKSDMVKILKEPISNYYVVLKDLGHGSYGQVKRVRHKKLGEDRAMKIVNKKSGSSANEIEILKKISHPNIANVFEIFEDSKRYYIMMEFLEGGELFDVIIANGYFGEADAARIMKQLLSAVNYLHSINITHRDLKPENIMLTSKPKNNRFEIKLIDFGTACIFEPGKKMTKFIGTSYYIAPEVIKESYDEKCDIWSCGIILYILLCGYPPFNGSNNVEIFRSIQNNQVSFSGDEWNDVTKEAIDLLRGMLNKTPSKRFTAEKCLNHKWFKMLEEVDKSKSDRRFKKLKIETIAKMSKFVQENRFKQAVLQFISTQFNLKTEENEFKQLFKELDTGGKGQISKEAFTKELIQLYGEDNGKEICNKIFSHLDLDGSGQISYDEFLSAMIDSKKVITEDRLQKAFKMFDKDNSGRLSVHEIMGVFGGEEKEWRKVIEDVDLNKDGEVDFNEFKRMMMNIDNKIVFGEEKK